MVSYLFCMIVFIILLLSFFISIKSFYLSIQKFQKLQVIQLSHSFSLFHCPLNCNKEFRFSLKPDKQRDFLSVIFLFSTVRYDNVQSHKQGLQRNLILVQMILKYSQFCLYHFLFFPFLYSHYTLL